MRTRYLAFLTLLFTSVLVLSATHGQDPRKPPMPPPVVPATYKEAVPAPPAPALPTSTPAPRSIQTHGFPKTSFAQCPARRHVAVQHERGQRAFLLRLASRTKPFP